MYTTTAPDCRPPGCKSEDAQPYGAGQEAKFVDAHFTGEENAWRLEVATRETAGSSAFCPESESEPGCLHRISSHFLLCEPTLTTEPLCAHLSDCRMEVVTRFLTPRVDQNELGFGSWVPGTLCRVCHYYALRIWSFMES